MHRNLHRHKCMQFGGDEVSAEQLKVQFRQKFSNISSIMDCVGCTKCRLWGKVCVLPNWVVCRHV